MSTSGQEASTVPLREGVSARGIHYVTAAGDGADERAVVVFAHGVWGRGRWWTPWFASLVAGFRPVAIDVPGYGDSPITDEDAATRTLDTWSHYVLSMLDELDATTAFLVGESTGGAAVLNAAALAPERVRGCVVSTTPFRGVVVHSTLGRYPELAAAGGVRAISDFMMPQLGLERSSEAFREDVRRTQHSCRADVVVHDAGLWAQADLSTRLARIECPVLVIGPGSSPILSVEASAGLARAIPGAELVVFGSGGHYLPFTDPELPAALAGAFLRRVVARERTAASA